MFTLPLPIQAEQSFSSKETADTYQFAVTVPPIDPESNSVAFLAVHTMVTSEKTGDYELQAALDEQSSGLALVEAINASHTTPNRRYVAGIWYALMPAEGPQTIVIKTSRKVNSIVAFFCIVEDVDQNNPLIGTGHATGNGDRIELSQALDEGFWLYAVQARRGYSDIQPVGDGNILLFNRATADPDDTQREVAAAVMASTLTEGDALLAAEATPSPSGLNLLLAVGLRPFVKVEEPPDDTDDLPRELMIIVRDIPPGGECEVRVVKPGTFVRNQAGQIDWDATPYTGFIVVNQEEEPE